MKNIIRREIVEMNEEILEHMEKLKKYKILIYPFNEDSIALKEVLESKLGVQVDFICNDTMPSEKCSSEVMPFCEVLEYKKSHDVCVFLSNKEEYGWFYDFEKFQNTGISSSDIVTHHQLSYYMKILENHGMEIDDFVKEYRIISSDEIVNKRADITFENLDECIGAYNLFADELSKKTFARILCKKILNCRFYFDVYSPNQYFDKSIIQLSENEVFFDAGAFTGDSIDDFIKNCGNKYNHIYAFEPDNSVFAELVANAGKYENITFFNTGLYDETQKVRFKNAELGSSHIWNWCDDGLGTSEYQDKCVLKGDVLNLEPTFIKMDIEGAEIKALSGLEKTIKTNHPQLAICAYHMPDDIWKIPSHIKKMDDNYKIYFRHHSYTDSETVCYATR